jgi:DNA polymerase III subunit gamma/tau
MEYTVLARRFRPQSFGEVIGQENISQALRNAIASNRVAHAYLFTGARGVGKTSTARILAKSLNCPNNSAGDPCNECDVCRTISNGSDVDVIEIDGASNRGIDEIRALRANVNVKPMRCRHKIYIIDEVHMLTKEAFNALLKTLEEPPPNVKFIFCTTDPQKLPDTILSRCQRFDFGTIATETIGRRLAEIAAAEGVAVDAQAVALVARRAAGSMRDSQSLFDQLLAFGGKEINAADVHRLLGTAPDERLVELGQALVDRQRPRILELFETALGSGVQISELTDQLMAYFRDLMVLASGAAEAHLISVDGDRRAALAVQARTAGLQTILAALQIIAETKLRMKGANFARVLLELALIRIGSLDQLDDLAELIGRLRPGTPASGPAVPSVPRVTANPQNPPQAPSVAGRPTPGSGVETRAFPAALERESLQAGPSQGTAWQAGESQSGTTSADSNQPSESVENQIIIPLEAGRESEILSQVISMLSDMAKSHAKNVCHTAILGPNTLVLTFPKSYHLSKQYFERSPEQLRRIEKALEQVVGRPIRVNLTVDESIATPRPTEPSGRGLGNTEERKPSDADQDPLVQRAIAVFGATVVRVESGTASPGGLDVERKG